MQGNPYLSDKTGDFQDTASGFIPCQCIWQDCHYVPYDHQRAGGTPDQEDRGRSEAGADQPGRRIWQSRAGYYDRDSGSSHDQPGACQKSGFPESWNQ